MSKGAGATGKDVTGTIIKGVFHLGEIFFYKGNLRLFREAPLLLRPKAKPTA
jgi:hypothetical protein